MKRNNKEELTKSNNALRVITIETLLPQTTERITVVKVILLLSLNREKKNDFLIKLSLKTHLKAIFKLKHVGYIAFYL